MSNFNENCQICHLFFPFPLLSRASAEKKPSEKTDVVLPMMPVYKWLIEKAPDLRILVYSGDDDTICATLGSQQWIWDLGYEVSSPWAPWKMDGQVSGFHVSFGQNGTAFQFATVHGAGHMVPSTRPAQGLEVLSNYLSGKW